MNLFNEIENIRERGEQAILCIIVQTKGSTPRKVGAKMIVKEDGSILGTIGGGALEKKVIEQAIVQMKLNAPDTFKYNLVKDLEMCCGGSVAIYFEPIMKNNTLYIFGAGHTGKALAKIAVTLDFEVILFDDRIEYLENINVENVNTQILDFKKDLEKLNTDGQTYVAIMTYSHPLDRHILSHFIDKELAYLGMIGSKRKIAVTKKMLRDEKRATVKQISKIDMPMGIDINPEEPEEIAVSILAKLIAIKNE